MATGKLMKNIFKSVFPLSKVWAYMLHLTMKHSLMAPNKAWKNPSVSLRKLDESDIHLSYTKGKQKKNLTTAQLKKKKKIK